MSTTAKVKVVMQFYYIDAPKEPPVLSQMTVVINSEGSKVPLDNFLFKFAGHFLEFLYNTKIVPEYNELIDLAKRSFYKFGDMKITIVRT